MLEKEYLAIPTVAYRSAGNDPNRRSDYCDITPGVFHTYNLIWTPTTMTFTYDGVVCLTDTLKVGGGPQGASTIRPAVLHESDPSVGRDT